MAPELVKASERTLGGCRPPLPVGVNILGAHDASGRELRGLFRPRPWRRDMQTATMTEALQFPWLLRALHRKRGAAGLLELADHYEIEGDPRYADIPRLLRAIGEGDPSNERWDETFRVAIAATEVR